MGRTVLLNRSLLVLCCLLAGTAFGEDSEAPWEVHGQVVDDHDQPTDDFDAATFWWANGSQWDANGELKNKLGVENLEKIWKDEGVPDANPKQLVQHEPSGKFKLKVEPRPRVAVFAYDKARKRGGFVIVEKEAAANDVTIKLTPLTRVHGKIVCAEEDNRVPEWTNATIRPPGDRQNYLGFTLCGSVRGEFAFLVPAGKYDLEIRSEGPAARMPKPHERKLKDAPADMPPFLSGIRIDVPPQPDLDLGALSVELPKDKNGVAHDLSLFYGKEPPPLSITDARGVPKTVKLSDYRGKWVLIDFWALWCGPCIYSSIPELSKFYKEHAADRDRFEILAICNTAEEKALTVEDYDTHAASVVKDVWEGKQPPFPILIDGKEETAAQYGIQSWPTTLLIDPEGHLVKNGGPGMLAKKLQAK